MSILLNEKCHYNMEDQLRILHCVIDDKFIDDLIDFTQTLWIGCYHEYAFIYKHPDIEFKYIHKQEYIKRFKGHQIVDYIRQKKFDVVIIHNLYSIPCYDLAVIPDNVIVVWFAWGYDIYEPTYHIMRPLIKKELYSKKTKQILKCGGNSCRDIIYTLISKTLRYRHYWKMKRAIHRIDFFSGVIPEEYEMIVADKCNKYFRASPLLFNYTSMQNKYLNENIDQPMVSGFDIQIGNSGDPTNNHIDVLDMLYQLNLGEKKIYCPISYSGPEYYRKIIKQYGEKMFGNRFNSLTKYIPLDEYNEILSSTRYSIFAMERQQGMGNIFSSLWEGRMVFLSESNPAYLSLKKRGYVLYTIQHDLERIERNETVSEKDVLTNRRLIIKYFSIEAERKKTNDIINTLNKNK